MGKKDKNKKHKPPETNYDLAALSKIRPTRLPKLSKMAKEEIIIDKSHPIEWKWLGLVIAVLALLVIVLFANTIVMKPVLDDLHTLSFLSTINSWAELWLSLWTDIFTRPLTQPWLKISYALDLQNYGTAFGWFHVVNVLLHMLCCLYLFSFVFWFARILHQQKRIDFEPRYLAAAAAAIFACHPLVTESVAYVSQRQAVLANTNFLLALNFFLIAYISSQKSIRFWYFLITGLAAFMAITTSANMIVLPMVMLAIAYILKRPETPVLVWLTDRPVMNGLLISFSCILPIFGFIDVKFLPTHYGYLPLMSPINYFACQLKAIATYYLRCLMLPFGLSIYPPLVMANSLFDPFSILGLVLVGLGFAALYWFRKYPALCLGLVLLLSGVVTQAFFIKAEIASDGMVYGAIFGIAIIIGSLLCAWSRNSFKSAFSCFCILIIIFSGLTLWRNWEWRSESRILQAAARVNPGSSQVHALIALQLVKKGNLNEAKTAADEAMKLDSSLSLAQEASAEVLLGENKYDEAKKAFDQAIASATKEHANAAYLANIKLGLAEAYLGMHKPELAMAIIQSLATQLSTNARAKYVLGKAWYEKQKYQQAVYFLELALRQDSSLYECWEPMIKSALALGMNNDAYQAAHMMNLQRSTETSKILLARAAAASGLPTNAEAELNNVIAKNPKNLEALVLLSSIEKTLGNEQKAADLNNQALKIDANAFSKYKFPELNKIVLPPSINVVPKKDSVSK